MSNFFAKAAQNFKRAAGFIANKLNSIRQSLLAKFLFKMAIALCITVAGFLFIASLIATCIASLIATCIAMKFLNSEQRQNQQNPTIYEVLPQEQSNSTNSDLAECLTQQTQELQPDDSQILVALTQKLYPQENPTWQSWITQQLMSEPVTEASTLIADATSASETKPTISTEFAITFTCWQAVKTTAEILNTIKASEMKKIAADLAIPKYRNMNKTQLLIEIVAAHESAPAFSS